MVWIRATPVLQHHFTLRRCKTHPKHTYSVIQALQKDWNLLGYSFSCTSMSIYSKSDNFLAEKISVVLFLDRDGIITITILMTVERDQACLGELGWKIVVGMKSAQIQRSEKWSKLPWNTSIGSSTKELHDWLGQIPVPDQGKQKSRVNEACGIVLRSMAGKIWSIQSKRERNQG